MATNYKAIAKKLKFEGRAFINGKYVNAIDGKKFDSVGNRILFFDPTQPHHSTSTTDVKRRLNVNINYL